MANNHVFEQKFSLRYFEMNKKGVASPTTVLTLLEETAADHCAAIGYGLYELEKRNIGWLLVSGVIEMARYPAYKETITIRTWLSKYSLVKGYRENVIFDGDGNEIGRARGLWVFYDIEKRRPVPIFPEIRELWGCETEASARNRDELLENSEGGNYKTSFDVFRNDMDNYKHLNNIRYFHFLLESLPDEVVDDYSLKTINARFYSEAKFGDKIRVFVNDRVGKNSFLHTMKNAGGDKTFVVAHTQWEKAS
jgi:acyl-ACP thioesterase